MNASVFFSSVGIKISTNAFQPIKDLICISLFGTLEDQVFNKMRESGLIYILVPGATINDNARMRDC